MPEACFDEQELCLVGTDGKVRLRVPTTTFTVSVDSSSGTPQLYLKVVDRNGKTRTLMVSEDEALALLNGLQRASSFASIAPSGPRPLSRS